MTRLTERELEQYAGDQALVNALREAYAEMDRRKMSNQSAARSLALQYQFSENRVAELTAMKSEIEAVMCRWDSW